MPHLYRAARLEALKKAYHALLTSRDLELLDRGFKGNIDELAANFKFVEDNLYGSEASQELDSIADALLFNIKLSQSKIPFLQGALRAQITGSIFTPFWNAAASFFTQTYFVKDTSLNTRKQSFLKLLAILPILNDIYHVDRDGRAKLKQNIVSNFILTLINPVKMLNSLLTFVEHLANRVLEVGLTPRSKTLIPQAFLKGVVGAAATIIRIPLTILQPFSDILPVVVNNLVIQPVKYVKNKAFPPTRHEINLDDKTTLGEHLGLPRIDPRRLGPETSFKLDLPVSLSRANSGVIDPRVSQSRGLELDSDSDSDDDAEDTWFKQSTPKSPIVIDSRVSRGRGHGLFDNVSEHSDEEEKFSHDEKNPRGPGN
ncbi:MAG: hypothetical protein P1U39_05315 [Legionellaceae bacterium]|nr:hypothetical protein [Legionellaceae bacterium]